MNFEKLAFILLKKIKSGQKITREDWPYFILINSKLLNDLRRLSSLTNNENMLTKREGHVGREYGLSFFFFIDDLFVSDIITGSKTSVNIGHKISFDQKYFDNNSKIVFTINFDSKKYQTKKFSTADINKEMIYGFFGSFHSHPKFYHDSSTKQWTFFSVQDIHSLLYGNMPVMGLITGFGIWLACKTSESKIIPVELLSEASKAELESENEGLMRFVKTNLREFGIVFYFAKFGAKLEKL